MFPKSLLFAFVASSLFLANVGVEASTSRKFRRDNDKSIEVTVTSKLSTNTGQTLGKCTFQVASEDQIFQPAVGPNALPIQSFITEAKRYAECKELHRGSVECVEKSGEVKNPGDESWWHEKFCERCSDADGWGTEDFPCSIPDDGKAGGKEGGK